MVYIHFNRLENFRSPYYSMDFHSRNTKFAKLIYPPGNISDYNED